MVFVPKTRCPTCGIQVAYRLLADGKLHIVWHKRWHTGSGTAAAMAAGLPGRILGGGGMGRCEGVGAEVKP